MKTLNKYILKPDYDSMETIKHGSLELLAQATEGSMYENMPYRCKVIGAPEKSKIREGDVVYVNFQAMYSKQNIEGEDCYVVNEDLIVAREVDGEIKAFKCVIVEPIQDRLQSKFLKVIQTDLPDATHGRVISSDVKPFKEGDEIDYENNIDWEFLLNGEKYYYIQWTHRILRVNGWVADGFNFVEPPEGMVEHNGILIQNEDQTYYVKEGRYAGKRVFLNKSALRNGSYIHDDEIYGLLEESAD